MTEPFRRITLGDFTDQAADGAEPDVTITVPEDLGTLSDADLTALHGQVLDAFNSLRDGIEGAPDQETLDTMTSLKDAKAVLDAEMNTRAEAASGRAASLASLNDIMNPAAGGDLSEDDLRATGPDASPDDETMADAPAAAGSVPSEVVMKAATAIGDGAKMLMDAANGGGSAPPAHMPPPPPPSGASSQVDGGSAATAPNSTATFAKEKQGKVMPQTINVGNLAARTNGGQAVRQAAGNGANLENLFTAAANVPGYAPDQALTMDAAPSLLDRAMRSASRQTVMSSIAAGQRFSQRHPIASINKRMNPSLLIADIGVNSEFTTEHPAYKYATDQGRLPGGSLVAAGGWCAPSETVYDLCALESTDGLISLPEINVARGGIRFTTGPDWTDIFDSTGFCFTEADDIAGIYGGNEVQTLSVPTTVTTWHVSFNGANGATDSLPVGATAAQVRGALEALSTVGPNNVYVTTPNAAANPAVYTIQFVNALGDSNVPQTTGTVDTGTGTITAATTTGGDSTVSGKPCNSIPCPPFTDVRLQVCGVCITGSNLQDTAYPELTKRYLQGAMTGHAHRLSTQVIASMITQSTALTWANNTNENAMLAPILSSIEFNVEDMRYKRRMARSTTLEAVFPFWVRGAIRADLSRRLGMDNPFDISDAQINTWFAQRGINPQFVYNWQNLGGTTSAQSWPASLQYLLYPAGTFVKGTQDIITLEMLHDSTLNATNNFTAIFTEEAWSVMKMCLESRVVTVTICQSGGSNAGTPGNTFACNHN